jgi:CBS domain-containing protein
MTRDVLTVSPETSLKVVAGLLAEHRISGLPVCAVDGRVLGVVSEADILWKELGVRTGSGGLLARILDSAYGTEQRAAATTAGEAMTAPAITVRPDAHVARAAELMIEHGVNRLPVVRDGSLAGIIARSDLVRAYERADSEIAQEISDEVLLHTLWIDPDTISVDVADGNVTLAGEVDSGPIAAEIEHFVRRVPGVASVRSELRRRSEERPHRVVTLRGRP